MFGGVFLLAAEGKRDENRVRGVGGDMWAGGAPTLEAGVFAADPGDISRYGDNRDGFCLAAVPVLCCGQRHRLALDTLDWAQRRRTEDRGQITEGR